MYWRTLLVALLVVTAGCSAFSVSDEPTPTVTPAPIAEPTETTETETSTLPPGVTADGDLDRERLARAHVDASEGSTYRWFDHHDGRRHTDNATRQTVIDHRATVKNETRYAYWISRQRATNGGSLNETTNVSEFGNAVARYERYAFEDPVFLEHRQRNASQRVGRKMATQIAEYLAVENATVTPVLLNGKRLYRITASEYALETAWSVEEYSVTAIVTTEGLVRRIDASYTISRDDTRVVVDYRFEYTPVESMTVERPDWVTGEWGPPRRLASDSMSSRYLLAR
ncbi:hypothetical protein BRC91_10250 [Halobacteriales archaeon QS_4_62_28]|nr:MAG: hypothetical protein BRC91_10250 [Halobacteriales archaeon QS_4_62_28]